MVDHKNLLGSQDAIRAVETRERGPALAERTAALARAAFSAGDRYPGLPPADGSAETAGEVRAELERGTRMWTALDEHGEAVGCVRAIPGPDGTWAVRRLGVVPRARGRSVGLLLMRALEDGARADGAARVVLDAVVERGNPPFYCRLGYRTTAHFPGPDKPLSEVHMEKDLAAPDEELPYPWGGEPVPLWDGPMRVWFSGPRGTVALPATPGPAPEAGLAVLAERAARRVGGPARFRGADGLARPGGVLVDPRPAEAVPAFVMPRGADGGALALWRTGG
ncbi:GNAT family N-acetyltransferase [Streptomyces sp. NPDC127066]|uniref:GNAT family N-acetyltransferase n=1 Tax=Streptomyces sp. NPDC127066 TaxID=3347125 RepID=UPI0036554987